MERLGVRLSVLALFLVIAVYILQGCGEMDNPSQDMENGTRQFTLNDGEHREDLVLTFDSVPVPFSVHWHW